LRFGKVGTHFLVLVATHLEFVVRIRGEKSSDFAQGGLWSGALVRQKFVHRLAERVAFVVRRAPHRGCVACLDR
jgi:hypothetical protein